MIDHDNEAFSVGLERIFPLAEEQKFNIRFHQRMFVRVVEYRFRMVRKLVSAFIPLERIEKSILLMRGQKVMLDRDLADLYGVKPIVLRQQVKRNIRRFPKDFMFQLSLKEAKMMVSQSVIPSWKSLGGSMPYVFTQEGVAMLSSVLHSERAIDVNIAIMRMFVRLREAFLSHKDLVQKLDELERKYDGQFHSVFETLRRLVQPLQLKRNRRIGFRTE